MQDNSVESEKQMQMQGKEVKKEKEEEETQNQTQEQEDQGLDGVYPWLDMHSLYYCLELRGHDCQH